MPGRRGLLADATGACDTGNMNRFNPEIFLWARKSAGLELDEAANKLKINPKSLVEIEAGGKEPTTSQLANMADAYRRPLTVFYMETPPAPAPAAEDFRSHIDADLSPKAQAILDAIVRSVRVRQGLLREAIEDAEEARPVEFIGAAKLSNGADAVAARIADVLKFDRRKFRAAKDADAAFALLREVTERAGVFVVLMGNLGSYHTNLDPRAFRGFSVADPVAPFIVVNETDTKAAGSFTLLHEMAHLVLGRVGISGYASETEIEKFCDTVAAKVLVDDEEFADFPRGLTESAALSAIHDFAAERKVSRKMVAFNLHRLGLISAALYSSVNARLFTRVTAASDGNERDGGGPNGHVIRKHRLGKPLVALVSRYLSAGVLTATRAATILGVKPTAVGPLLDAGRRAA